MITRLVALGCLVAVSLVLAGVLRRRDGCLRPVEGAAGFTADDLSAQLGTTATFVQFSAPTCAPCRAVRQLLSRLTADRPDLVHAELDVARCLDLARRHHVVSTPTVFVLDPTGRIRQRLCGVPNPGVLLKAVAELPGRPAEAPGALSVVRSDSGADHD